MTVDFGVAMHGCARSSTGCATSLDDWLAGVDGLDLLHGTATVVTDPAGQQHRVTVGTSS